MEYRRYWYSGSLHDDDDEVAIAGFAALQVVICKFKFIWLLALA